MSGAVGVTIGKFNPPHLGHLHLIETGAEAVEHLFVVVCERSDQSFSGDARRRWLADCAPPNVTVVVTPDDLPEASAPWAQRMLAILPQRPDVAYTSEPWGDEWAALMGARHVSVDRQRAQFPISGTALRADLGANFSWLVPAARAELARRVVLVGAESTGKSTLAEALAVELGTVWVPEHGADTRAAFPQHQGIRSSQDVCGPGQHWCLDPLAGPGTKLERPCGGRV